MRISDWSSDVCSSDLGTQRQRLKRAGKAAHLVAQLLEPQSLIVAVRLMQRSGRRLPRGGQKGGRKVGMPRPAKQLRPLAAQAGIGKVDGLQVEIGRAHV